MQKFTRIRQKVCLLLFMALGFYSSSFSQELSRHFVSDSNEQKINNSLQGISLASAIKEIEKNYGVQISYQKNLVDGKVVKSQISEDKSLEQSLHSLLAPFQLTYEKLKKGYYVIFIQQNETPERKNVEKLKNTGIKDQDQGSIEQKLQISKLKFSQKMQETSIPVQRVSGTITDENGASIPGVNIVVKGTAVGTLTDADGKYSLDVPNGSNVLIFSFVGYVAQEVEINGQTTIDVTLVEDINTLDEVVVIGYTSIAREKVLGAISTVGEEKIIENIPVTAFDAVQGRLSGVQILSNGGPGGGFDIRIRGISTFDSGTQPLYVVDGQQLEDIDNIDPNDIKSLEVLKDGATAAIYGSRGANGVVLITTKSGSASKGVKIDVTYNVDFTTLNSAIPTANTEQRLFYESVRRANNTALFGPDLDSLNLLYRNSIDLQDLITQTGVRNQVNVALNGGNKTAQVYWNMGFQDQEGIVLGSSYTRVNTRFKISLNPFKNFELGSNLNLSYEVRNGLDESSVFQQLVERIPYFPVFEPDGSYSPEFGGRQNPIAEADLRTLKQRDYRAQLFNYAQYDITPDLSIKSTLGINFAFRKFNTFEPTLVQNPTNPIPTGEERYFLGYDIQQENFLNYIKSFGKHSVSAFAGVQIQLYDTEDFRVRSNFVSDAIETFNNVDPSTISIQDGTSNQEHSLFSQFAGFNYDFDNKYLVGATIRRDGSSRFGEDNKYGIFPSFTLGWRISEESFLKGIDVINNLLLRFGYGQTGNEQIPNYDFATTYAPGSIYTGVSGSAALRLGNPEISWENTISTNLGFDLTLFDKRLNLTAEIWQKTTNDLLASVPIPEETGFVSIRQNVGTVQNRGIDILLSGTILELNDFSWEGSFNISFLKNEVTELAGGTPFFSGDYLIEEGEPIGNINGWKNLGIYQYDESNAYTVDGVRLTPNFDAEGNFSNYTLNGTVYEGEVRQLTNEGSVLQGGDIIWEDLNGDFDISVEDRQTIGNGLPKYFGGLTNTFTYKDFSLSFLFDYSFGNDIWRRYDEARNDLNSGGETPSPERIEGAWQEQGDITVWPRLTQVTQNRERPNSFFVTDGDFIKLRFIRLNYNLPKSLMSKVSWVDKVSFNISLNNFATWTSYEGYNPELGSRGNPLQPGQDDLRYPNTRSVIIGLKAQF